MTPHRILLCGVLACLFAASRAAPAAAVEYRFPDDAGVISVRDHGAAADGRTDDTAAIQKAIKAAIETDRYAAMPFVYFPDGTYLVSDTLASKVADEGWSAGWRAGMILLGESRDGVVLKLADDATGYDDPKSPKAVVATGSESDKRDNHAGGGNRAFRHSVINMTLDVGRHRGAVGIDYVVSNRGTIENVTVRADDGGGWCGIRMERWWPGPALIKQVTIAGFDYGMRLHHYQYSMTFEHITLSGQRQRGIYSTQNVLAIRGLHSDNRAAAIEIAGNHGHLSLLDSVLRGGEADAAAIISNGRITLRRVRTEGYGTSVDDRRKANDDVPGGKLQDIAIYATDTHTLGAPDATPLELPVRETPTWHTNDHDQWVSPLQFKADGVSDAEAIQKAINAGKPMVYLPRGHYNLDRPILIRGKVRKIMGMQSSISVPKGGKVEAVVRLDDGDTDTVILEHLRINVPVVHNSSRTLAMRHVDFKGYENTRHGRGDMFLEDTIGKPIRVLHPQRFWGRQVNSEFGDEPLIENHGGDMWLLGFKTEGQMTCIKTVKGRTVLYGSMLYPLRDPDPKTPAFINDGGAVQLTYAMNYKNYKMQIAHRPTADAAWSMLTNRDIQYRGPALLLSGVPTD